MKVGENPHPLIYFSYIIVATETTSYPYTVHISPVVLTKYTIPHLKPGEQKPSNIYSGTLKALK